MLSTIKAILAQAVENGMIKTNIAQNCKVPKGKKKEECRVLTIEEQRKFIILSKNICYGEIFIFALGTGARIGEILALTWDDVDLEMATVRINKTTSVYADTDRPDSKYQIHVGEAKTKSSNRTLPLLPELITILRKMKDWQSVIKEQEGENYNKGNLIFCSKNGELMYVSTVRRYFNQIKTKMNIEDIHIHCLRHTFATRCLENGIELKIVQELLGHSGINITANLYTHVLGEKKQESILKIANTLE